MDWLKSFIKSIAENEVTSWISHWMIAWGIVLLSSWFVGTTGAYIVSQLVLMIFLAREVENYIRLNKLLDGIMDMVGPVIAWLLMSYVVLG